MKPTTHFIGSSDSAVALRQLVATINAILAKADSGGYIVE